MSLQITLAFKILINIFGLARGSATLYKTKSFSFSIKNKQKHRKIYLSTSESTSNSNINCHILLQPDVSKIPKICLKRSILQDALTHACLMLEFTSLRQKLTSFTHPTKNIGIDNVVIYTLWKSPAQPLIPFIKIHTQLRFRVKFDFIINMSQCHRKMVRRAGGWVFSYRRKSILLF